MKKTIFVLLTLLMALAVCTDKKASNPYPNRPPETHLFLTIGDSLGVIDSTALPDTSASKLVLHWYGDDPDGEVIGYQWAWDDTSGDSSWTFTELSSDTFYVQIRTTFDFFTFYIRAMDSDSMVDPTPSILTFPIINSPPTVNLPAALINSYSTEVSLMLSYHTFTWSSSDPDGDETISGYDLALMDTSFHWDPDTTITDSIRFAGVDWSISLDSLTFSYTFSDLDPGCYRMFLRSYDIAGAYSNVVYYPETSGVWQVLEKNGQILYVDDNQDFYDSDHIYTDQLDSLGFSYTALNFEERPFYYPRDLELTINDFDIVIWNAGYSRHFRQTSSAIASFLENDGHLMMNALFSSGDTTLYPFMPIDTIYTENIFRPPFFNAPGGADPVLGYPDSIYATISRPLSYTFGFAPRAPEVLNGMQYKVLYVRDADTVAVRIPFDPSLPEQEPARLVFFSFSVFDCNRFNDFELLFEHILVDEFKYVP